MRCTLECPGPPCRVGPDQHRLLVLGVKAPPVPAANDLGGRVLAPGNAVCTFWLPARLFLEHTGSQPVHETFTVPCLTFWRWRGACRAHGCLAMQPSSCLGPAAVYAAELRRRDDSLYMECMHCSAPSRPVVPGRGRCSHGTLQMTCTLAQDTRSRDLKMLTRMSAQNPGCAACLPQVAKVGAFTAEQVTNLGEDLDTLQDCAVSSSPGGRENLKAVSDVLVPAINLPCCRGLAFSAIEFSASLLGRHLMPYPAQGLSRSTRPMFDGHPRAGSEAHRRIVPGAGES